MSAAAKSGKIRSRGYSSKKEKPRRKVELPAGSTKFPLDAIKVLLYVHMNMHERFRRFLMAPIRKRRRSRPRQLELNLWPNQIRRSKLFSRKSATTYSAR